jgi:hypothetical protein
LGFEHGESEAFAHRRVQQHVEGRVGGRHVLGRERLVEVAVLVDDDHGALVQSEVLDERRQVRPGLLPEQLGVEIQQRVVVALAEARERLDHLAQRLARRRALVDGDDPDHERVGRQPRRAPRRGPAA